MDSLMTHFIGALIVIAFCMTSNSARALETAKKSLENRDLKLNLGFQFSLPLDLSN